MKKLFAAIVVLAMLVSMFAVVSHAADFFFQYDGAYLTNDEGVKTHNPPHVPTEEDKNVFDAMATGEIGSIYGLGFGWFHIQGWVGSVSEYEDLGYQINGGEIDWGHKITGEDGLAKAAGWAYCHRYNVTIPIQEGTVTMNFFTKAGDSTTLVKTITYVNEEASGPVFERKSIGSNDTSPANAIWLNQDGEYTAVKFTTTGEIGGIEFSYWASNPDTGTGPRGAVKVELFAFDKNYDTTVAKSPVYTKEFAWIGDNNPALSLQFDEPVGAGTYILRVTIFGETATGVDKETAYLVLPDAVGEFDTAKFTFYNNVGEKGAQVDARVTNITLLGPSSIRDEEYFATNPADTASEQQQGDDTPETPQTGDSTVIVIFALVAVIALAATVLVKKRSF